MPVLTVTDYVLTGAGRAGLYVQLRDNVTPAITFTSATPTDSNGQFSIAGSPPPPADYSAYTSPLIGAGAVWTLYDPHFRIAYTRGDTIIATVQAITEATLVAGLDASAGEVVTVTLTANRVVGLPANPTVGQTLELIFTEGGAGTYTLTWPAGIQTSWQPVPVAGAISSLKLRYYGVNWQVVGGQVPVSQGGVLSFPGQVVAAGFTAVAPGSPNTPDPSGRPLTVNQGDNGQFIGYIFGYPQVITGTLMHVAVGTAAAPDTNPNPVFKVVRTLKLLHGVAEGDGSEQTGSISGVCIITASAEVQGIGVSGFARTASTVTVPPSIGADAVGMYGSGYATDSSIRAGIGHFGGGGTTSAVGFASGGQFDASNRSASPHSINATFPSNTQTLFLTPSGGNQVGAGIEFQAGPGPTRYGTGIHFIGGITNNATINNDIQSDSTATTSIQINGTHTNALVVATGAGLTLLNNGLQVTGLVQFTNTNALGGELRLIDSVSTKTFGFASSASSLTISEVSVADRLYILIGGGLTLPNGNFLLTGGGIGFWGHAAPGAQPVAIASPTAPSAGYVQAEAQSMKTAVDAIRAALSGSGFTA